MNERALVRYRGPVYDSGRWEGFRLRPDDIIISTPPKCGTTWTQMICALLILQDPVLDASLSTLSPWLDATFRARIDVVADLESQQRRRFIKTHTPLDGLPLHGSVTYICVGRDPRDVALSMDNHWANMDVAGVQSAITSGAKIDGMEPLPVAPRVAPPESEGERFWLWVDDDAHPETKMTSLNATLRHVKSFRDGQDTANVIMLHYDDLKADLEGEMRALAKRLGITVSEERWEALVAAASFEEMRRNADRTAPNAEQGIWRDNQQFFRRGSSGGWRDVVGEEDLPRYWERVAALADPGLSAWLHRDASGPVPVS